MDTDDGPCVHEFKTTTVFLGQGQGLIERVCVHCGAPQTELVKGLPAEQLHELKGL